MHAVCPARLMLLALITLIVGLFGEALQNCIFCVFCMDVKLRLLLLWKNVYWREYVYLREERTGGWRKVHNENFSVLHWYFVLFGPLNCARCLDRFTAHMWEEWRRCNYKMLNVMPGRTRRFSTCRRRWKQIFRMIFGKQAMETDWIHLIWIARWSAVWFLLNRRFILPLIDFEPKWVRRM